jgi:hypothetical protein
VRLIAHDDGDRGSALQAERLDIPADAIEPRVPGDRETRNRIQAPTTSSTTVAAGARTYSPAF